MIRATSGILDTSLSRASLIHWNEPSLYSTRMLHRLSMVPFYLRRRFFARPSLGHIYRFMQSRGFVFPVIMCLLTVATVVGYSRIVDLRRLGQEYNFVVRTDSEGVSEIRAHLADNDFCRVEEVEISEGLYRITFRCPADKVGAMWSVINRIVENREGK